MSNILETILSTKHAEIAARLQHESLSDLAARATAVTAPTRGFVKALRDAAANQRPGVIAEIKKASPSKGVIRAQFDPVAIAKSYAKHGATCLSVLTDEAYFQGSDAYLEAVVQAVNLPTIRKDFIVHPYQVYEARCLGADCVLLIVAALDQKELMELYNLAHELSLDVLIEVHDAAELERALALQPKLIGINNRNLKTFATTTQTTLDLLADMPSDTTVVTESGISTRADVDAMLEHEVYCFLIGEAFMRAPEPGVALAELFKP